jgi:polyhydroxyalkanoate synthesis repressor PhaR
MQCSKNARLGSFVLLSVFQEVSVMARKGSKPDNSAPETITIKKYANRRLYNTAESSYVTLEDLAKMVQQSVDFTVHDAKTGDDITRAVLTQIIVEQESKGNNLLPTGFLRQLISYYGDNLQGLVPQYLDMTMQSFAHNQEKMRSSLENALGDLYPFSSIEDMGRKNMAIFEQAMSMMTPFQPGQPGGDDNQGASGPAPHSAAESTESGRGSDDAIDMLKSQLEAMQRQLDSLSSNKDG